ncbi:MAG: riboflavin synthase [Candidatus Eremiobacteraeota bacterium]|nr:riboflavin synthase [Candidatus Eremiobacteraeota bacterium]
MFTGLIAHLGRVVRNDRLPDGGMRLIVEAPGAIAEGVRQGDSIAVDGTCLTVAALGERELGFEVVPETLARTTLGGAVSGAPVNVELSLRLGDRLGGHLVYGHVDATAQIVEKKPEGQGYRLTLQMPDGLSALIIEKGFIALDGVSLTIASVRDGRFDIALIPETSARTTFGSKGTGSRVNVEIDPVARYVLAGVEAYRAPHTQPVGDADELAWAYEI